MFRSEFGPSTMGSGFTSGSEIVGLSTSSIEMDGRRLKVSKHGS